MIHYPITARHTEPQGHIMVCKFIKTKKLDIKSYNSVQLMELPSSSFLLPARNMCRACVEAAGTKACVHVWLVLAMCTNPGCLHRWEVNALSSWDTSEKTLHALKPEGMYMGGRYQHRIYIGGSSTPSSFDSLLGVISHQAARMSHVPGKDRSQKGNPGWL